MSEESRRRLARVVRDPRADLAEAALLCCVEIEPDLDVQVEMLRLDALADRLRTSGFAPGPAVANARALAGYLGDELGFAGDPDDYHDPRNSLLTTVLDRRRGIPITLSIVYVAVATRVGVSAFGVNTPGHFLAAIGPGAGASRHPSADVTVIDPFHGGAVLTDAEIDARIRAATADRITLEPHMLRPVPPATVVRRLLNNLLRDFLAQGDIENAVWAAELRRLLPDTDVDDVRALAELLVQIGRYRDAVRTIERHVADDDGNGLRQLLARARAKMN
jgi:regulator of sirC expression with transglutaminase-like and TPR domain